MKRIIFIIALALSLVGCSDETLDSFEWTDKDAIVPILSDPETETELFSGLNVTGVAKELLKQNGIYFENSFPSEGVPQSEAIVINDRQVISDVVEQFGFDSEAIGVETKKHSLVVGYVYAAVGGKEVRQRAKKIFGGVSLRLTIEQVYSGVASPCRTYFMALYDTELPSGQVDRIYCTYK